MKGGVVVAVTAVLNQASETLLIKIQPLDTWPPKRRPLFSFMCHKLVRSSCTIDKVISDALLRDLLDGFLAVGKKYTSIYIFEIFLIPAIFVSELDPTDSL